MRALSETETIVVDCQAAEAIKTIFRDSSEATLLESILQEGYLTSRARTDSRNGIV